MKKALLSLTLMSSISIQTALSQDIKVALKNCDNENVFLRRQLKACDESDSLKSIQIKSYTIKDSLNSKLLVNLNNQLELKDKEIVKFIKKNKIKPRAYLLGGLALGFLMRESIIILIKSL